VRTSCVRIWKREDIVRANRDFHRRSGWTGPTVREAALEATQGQMDGFFSQLPYKCYLEEVASVGD